MNSKEQQIIELQKQRDTVHKRLNNTSDQFFIYGYVRQLEDIDKQISIIKNTLKNEQ